MFSEHISFSPQHHKSFLTRQYISYNLTERIRLHEPYCLQPQERNWLVFQLLYALCQLDSRSHGDIKPENILVTSLDHLFLCDLMPCKPACIPDSIQEYNKWFGYLDNNQRCYTAPERWDQSQTQKRQPMDVFSVACCVYEIMTGECLFDLSRLKKFKKGDYQLDLGKILDKPVVRLLTSMLDLNPAKRPSAVDCFRAFLKYYPQGSQLYHISAQFQKIAYLYSDHKVDLICDYQSVAGKEYFHPVEIDYKPGFKACELIPIMWLATLIPSCWQEDSKVKALLRIQQLSSQLDFNLRLQYVLPLVVQAFQAQPKTQVCALNLVVNLFRDSDFKDNQAITALDSKVIRQYLLPKVRELMNQRNGSVRFAIATNLHRIVKLSTQLVEMAIDSYRIRKQQGIEQSFMEQSLMMSTRIGRGGIDTEQMINLEEQINWEREMQELWCDTEFIILELSQTEDNYECFVALLSTISQLVLLFPPSKCELLKNLCLMGMNKQSLRVKQQILRSLLELGLRLGSQALKEMVEFIIESLMETAADDLIIIECIETITKLVNHKLISVKQLQKLLEQALVYLWLPNKRIRQRICHLVLVIQHCYKDSFQIHFMPTIQKSMLASDQFKSEAELDLLFLQPVKLSQKELLTNEKAVKIFECRLRPQLKQELPKPRTQQVNKHRVVRQSEIEGRYQPLKEFKQINQVTSPIIKQIFQGMGQELQPKFVNLDQPPLKPCALYQRQAQVLPINNTIQKVNTDEQKWKYASQDSTTTQYCDGRLITTIYGEEPVHSVTRTMCQEFFLTASKSQVQLYKLKSILADVSQTQVQTFERSEIKTLCMLQNSSCFAIGSESGIELVDLYKYIPKAKSMFQQLQLDKQSVVQLKSVTDNLLFAAEQSGTLKLYDLRQQKACLHDDDFGKGKGTVSALSCDSMVMTVGTLSGQLAAYDLRYGVTSSLYQNSCGKPITALACHKERSSKGDPSWAWVSVGNQICQFNMDRGILNSVIQLHEEAEIPQFQKGGTQKLFLPSFTEEKSACRSILVTADECMIGAGNDRIIRSWRNDSNVTKVIVSPFFLHEKQENQEPVREVDVVLSYGLSRKVKVFTESLSVGQANLEAHQGAILDMTFCGESLVTCGADGQVKIWK